MQTTRSQRFVICAAFLVGGTLCNFGCGQKTYEDRLHQSRLFYEYLQTVEDALSPTTWKRPDLKMSIRLPKPFIKPMPGPEPFKDKEGDISYGPDPRQKNSLNIELPGLLEAWEASLESTDGQPDSWIYLVSNHERFVDADNGGLAPEQFLTDLENDLMRVFQVTVPEGETSRVDDNVRFRQFYPAQNAERALYTTPKDYSVIRFVPNEEFNSADLQATLFERKVGRNQVALIVLTKKSTSAGFRQRLDIALETFEIAEVVPGRPHRGAPGPGGTPSSGGAPQPARPAPSGF